MVLTLQPVRDKKTDLMKVYKIFDVPGAALKDYINRRGKDAEDSGTVRMGRKPVLPVHIENELVNYCFLLERNFFFGLTTKDIKRMAFQLAVTNNLQTHFVRKNGKLVRRGFEILSEGIQHCLLLESDGLLLKMLRHSLTFFKRRWKKHNFREIVCSTLTILHHISPIETQQTYSSEGSKKKEVATLSSAKKGVVRSHGYFRVTPSSLPKKKHEVGVVGWNPHPGTTGYATPQLKLKCLPSASNIANVNIELMTLCFKCLMAIIPARGM
jgi:hypothetical protein